jgi:hypothetical protein
MNEHLPFDDDYELIDTNFDEFIRRGLEEVEWERKQRMEG